MHLNVNYKHLLVSPDLPISSALQKMTDVGIGFLMAVGSDGKLAGTVMDSDFRKAILRGVQLTSPLSLIMNPSPVVAIAGAPRAELQQIFTQSGKSCIPLVSSGKEVMGIAFIAEYILEEAAPRNTKVVIMAGGRGTRLRPLTDNIPKAMVPFGGKPLLECIIERLIANGFRQFAFSVNYLAEQVVDYFGDGSRWNSRIEYLREEKSLGTAGSLSLLQEATDTILMLNGDLLTNLNFGFLIDYHLQEKALATACVCEYTMQVPYGVIETADHRLQSIQEKPTLSFNVNAGMYALQAEVLNWLPKNTYYDMPSFLVEIQRRSPGSIACFPVQEYWIDIGRMQDYTKAQEDYDHAF